MWGQRGRGETGDREGREGARRRGRAGCPGRRSHATGPFSCKYAHASAGSAPAHVGRPKPPHPTQQNRARGLRPPSLSFAAAPVGKERLGNTPAPTPRGTHSAARPAVMGKQRLRRSCQGWWSLGFCLPSPPSPAPAHSNLRAGVADLGVRRGLGGTGPECAALLTPSQRGAPCLNRR